MALIKAGFKLITATDSEESIKKLYASRPCVVIMSDDLASAGEKKLHVRIRELSAVPCIVLGHKDYIGRAMMVEEGADLYLDSSIRPRALVAFVRSLIKRYRSGPSEPRFNTADSEVQLGDLRTKLTNTEFRLLSCLAFNQGQVLSYAMLLNEVWGKEVALEVVHQYIRRLKQKLGIDSVGPYRLLNYRGEGYCFCADVVSSG